MVHKITSASQARDILRFYKNHGKPTPLVFDIDSDCHEEIPVVWRRCTRCTSGLKRYEYMGVNIREICLSNRSTYCPYCHNLLYTIICVDLVVQGDRVLNTGYRQV